MDGMRTYRAPSGYCYQYEEGKQPDGYVLAEQAKQPEEQAKRRAPRNKTRKADNK